MGDRERKPGGGRIGNLESTGSVANVFKIPPIV